MGYDTNHPPETRVWIKELSSADPGVPFRSFSAPASGAEVHLKVIYLLIDCLSSLLKHHETKTIFVTSVSPVPRLASGTQRVLDNYLLRN